MMAPAILYGLALVGSCITVSGTIYSPSLKVDQSSGLRLYKNNVVPRGNDLEYTILKREPSQDVQESADSKERRSQMGSSFIRFGRSRYEQPSNTNNNLESGDYASGNEFVDSGLSSSATASRIARGRSDVIIRFGRADVKNYRNPTQQQHQLSSVDTKILRFANKTPRDNSINDFDEQLSVVCSNVLGSTDNGNDVRLYLTKLARLCNSLGLGIEENYETRRKSKIIEILEDATSQGESSKHE